MREPEYRNDEARPLPPYGLTRTLHVLATHSGKLLFANILAVIFSIPVITIPAALTGLHAVVQQYYRKGYGDVWPRFFEEFKTAFFPRLGISAVLAALPVAGWMIGGALGEIYSYCVCAFLVVLDAIVFHWWFPQMAVLKLSARQALRNAFLMAFIAAKENLILVVVNGVTAAAAVLFWPVSFLLIALFIPALLVLLNTHVVNPVLDERLIRSGGEEEKVGEE